ncbi:MAG: HIT family protein [Gemmatimonadetes bacterium]|nr:HIT family protein [Gemmatimonadota bacterium]
MFGTKELDVEGRGEPADGTNREPREGTTSMDSGNMGVSTTRHCIFCEIVHGAGEASICYEDGDAIALMDIQPVNAGHVLVVPKAHFDSMDDVPEELALHLFSVALRLSPVVRRLAGASAVNVVVSSGREAGQDVFHHHVHLIPRVAGDGFDVPLPFPGSGMPDRTTLDAMAARIMCAMHDPVRRVTPLGVAVA